jgi:GT2 family glycosyltransferase
MTAKTKWVSIFRLLYMRLNLLRVIRKKYLYYHPVVKSQMCFWKTSKANLPALQALTNRRAQNQFNEYQNFSENDERWPTIDVSVVSFNSIRWIGNFISTLLAQNYPLSKINLFFVDHGSTDGTVEQIGNQIAKISDKFASVKLIQQENLGFGAGHDTAIKMGQSPFCLVTNLDVEFLSSSLCNVIHAALCDKNNEVASWELRQIPYEHPKYYDPVTLETNWSSHACVLIRRSAYTEVGGYDQHIFMYVEDVELSYRFRSYGHVLKYVPNAVIKHFSYESAGEIKPLQFIGSSVGNVYIRMRYGDAFSKMVGYLIYGIRLILPSPFNGANTLLLKKVPHLLQDAIHFSTGKGTAKSYFPLRGIDYEMVREGAFYEIHRKSDVSAAVLVTVITRTYHGRAMFLKQAIQSVFNQTYDSIELIVVEDGGDSQHALVSSLLAPHGCQVRYISNAKLGRSAAGNAGMAAATGEYVMFLDDDDLLFADHIEILVSELQRNPKLAAAYSLAMEVRTKVAPDNLSYVEEHYSTPKLFHQEWDYDVLLDHNFIPIQAILFKQELYKHRGGFDIELDQLEDWNLWLRYGFDATFQFVPKTTSLFRSPADLNIRNQRHELLHIAYDVAKRKALLSVQKRED